MTPTQTDGNGAVAAPEEQQQQPSFARQMLTSMLQMLLISFVTRYALSYFMNTSSRSNGPSPVERGGAQSASLWVFSEERSWDDELVSSPSLIWKLDGLIFGDYSSGLFGNATYYHTTTFDASKSLSQNGRLYLTSCFLSATHDESPDLSKGYHWKGQSCYKKEITHHRKYKPANRRKLLEGIKGVGGVTVETPLHDEMAERYNDTELTHWNSRLSINAVYGLPSFKGGEVPDPMNKFVYVDPDSRMTYPVVYHNDFWNYHSEYTPVTHLNRTLTLNLMFYPISFFKWQFYLAQNEQHQWSFMQKNSPNELDSMKRLFLETNFYVLTLTISVSILHTVFEMLAFKHDIQFWRERTTHEGLSLRSVLFGIVQHVIVLLYVLDNETNVMVTLGLGLGLLIELWKITKIFHIGVKRFSPSFPVPVPTLTYRSSAYLESKTHEYDTIAFKYLSVALFPLVISYAAYSLMYHEHKGWYSFVLGVLYGCLLTFGFIMMTPQLFINYKLKSVAHLPWKMLTYKALNTFIDDIFAFVITMPTLYRLGCLRDDMIFLVYLYQRWIYPTDMTRVNEFGVSGQVENNEKQ